MRARIFKRGRGWMVPLAVLALTTAACGAATEQEEEPPDGGPQAVRMNYTSSAEGLLAWVAAEEAYFEACGLDVELEQVAGSGLTPIALENDEVQLGTSTAPDFLLAVNGGLDLVAVAGMSVNRPDNPRLFVIAGTDSGIVAPEDLQGARIGTPTRGGSFEISTTQLLVERGIDADTITWVEVPFAQQVEAVTAGRVDAVATAVTLRGPLLGAGGHEVLDLSAFADEVLVTFLSARRDWAQDNQPAINCVRQALQEAANLLDDDPDRAIEIVVDYTGLPPEAAANVPLANPLVTLKPQHLELWATAMVDQGLIEPLDADELLAP